MNSKALTEKTPLSGQKTSILEKIAFFYLNAGTVTGSALIAGALLLFYTDVAGLDPAKIGIMFLIARIFDGFNDPVQAYIIDHLPRTKMGRFRLYLIIGAFLFSINFVLAFFGPYWATSGKMVVAWITYLMLDMTSCIMTIPNDCMLPVMTDDPKDRNLLALIKGVAVTFGNLIVGMPLPLLLASMPDNQAGAFGIVVFGGAIVMIVFVSLGTLGVKERIPAEPEQKYTARELLTIVLQRPVYALFLSYLLINIAAISSATVSLYFFTYVVKNLTVMPLLSVASIVGGLCGVPIAPILANRYGKRTSFMIGALIMFLACALRLINVTAIPLLLLTAGITTFGSSMAHPIAYGIMADNTDYIEFKLNKRAEGAVASLNSLVAKASAGIGGALVGLVLAWTGYIAPIQGSGVIEQTQQAQNGIILLMVGLPTLANLVAAVLFRLLYPLTNDKMKEITEELRSRRIARGEEAEVEAQA